MVKIYKSIALNKIRTVDYDKNVQKCCWKGEEPCFICGRPVNIESNRTKYLQYNRDNEEVTDYMGDIGSKDPECFPVGCGCFKRFRELGKDTYVDGDLAEIEK